MDWILRNPWEYNRNPFFALNCSNPAFGAGRSYVWISGRTTKYVRRKENRTGLAATCTPSRGKTHLNIRFLNLGKLWRREVRCELLPTKIKIKVLNDFLQQHSLALQFPLELVASGGCIYECFFLCTVGDMI